MRYSSFALLAALAVAGCDDVPTHVFFNQPSSENLVGTWSGVEEITTAEDIGGSNVGSPADRGFTFPVLMNFEHNGRFTLITSGYSTSFDDESDRTCWGSYTRSSHTISLFPFESCRALPLTRYTLGSVLPNGITLQAHSTAVNNPSASYLTMRVFIRLERD
ncbi:MAG TPA: hypothetical protein VFO52_10940 [Longimicrobiales bacterium]|nr:hypothetical protein [Longimicrobiales bacterium]